MAVLRTIKYSERSVVDPLLPKITPLSAEFDGAARTNGRAPHDPPIREFQAVSFAPISRCEWFSRQGGADMLEVLWSTH